MTRHTVSTAVALLLATSVAATLNAQPVQKQPPPPSSALRVLDTKTLPGEDPTVQAVLSRLRAKLNGDATFVSRLDAAHRRGDLATVGSLLGAAAQVPRNSLVYGGLSKTGSIDAPGRGLFRFASYDAEAMRNPWYLIVSVGGRVYCASTSAQTCHDALHKMGYANTEQIW